MMKGTKALVFGVCIVFVLLGAFAGVASAATIYVPDDYAKIQWAVDNASAGDTIIVRDGTYAENVDVNKHLMTQSENRFIYVLDDNDPDYSNPPFNDTLSVINASLHEIVNTMDRFNICQTIGGWRAIATYTDGTCIVAEFVAKRLSRWNAQGDCIFSIDMARDAIDVSENGNIYALTSSGTIYGNSTVILDGMEALLKKHLSVVWILLLMTNSILYG